MSGVRAFAEETDLRQVAELHRMVFGQGGHGRPDYVDSYERYFREVFLNNPWRDDGLPSLVYEADGRVVGFLGVIPRRMRANGQPLRVAIPTQLMVHPKHRGRVGVQLVKTFLSGPQDLSMTEGNHGTRAIWEGLGGTMLPLYSIRWTRPLRPGRFLLSFLRRHDGPAAPATTALTPVAATFDGILRRLAPASFRVTPPDAAAEELTGDALLAEVSEVSHSRSLYPDYDRSSIEWLFAILGGKTDRGRLRKARVRNAAGEAVGSYVYYRNPGAISEVVQISARPGRLRDVFAHLCHDAWTQGAIAVAGQLDPPSIQPMSEVHCLMHGSGGSWILAHARRPDRLEPLHRGDAWFTRMEGEWWIGF